MLDSLDAYAESRGDGLVGEAIEEREVLSRPAVPLSKRRDSKRLAFDADGLALNVHLAGKVGVGERAEPSQAIPRPNGSTWSA